MRQSTNGSRGARAVFFLVAIAMLVIAGSLVFFAFRSALRSNQIIRDGGASGLTLAERLYLQAYLSSRVETLYAPAGAATAQTEFEIEPGLGAGQIADTLISLDLLSDRELFLNYVKYYGVDQELEAGYFIVPAGASIVDLAAILTEARDPTLTITMLEGWRLEEMARALVRSGEGQIDPERFLAITRRQVPFDLTPFDFLASLPPSATLEGYLFPDTYLLPRDATAEDLVTAMLENFGQKVDPGLRQAYGLQNISLRDAVILASLVQREAVLDEEKPLIAAVFLNRLARNMPLEADPTVQYALGYQPDTEKWWKTGLTLADLRTDSPYNTYLYRGLMPGPIASPGLAALEAVAHPAAISALFFVVDCTAATPNAHFFSNTFEEHLAHVIRCR